MSIAATADPQPADVRPAPFHPLLLRLAVAAACAAIADWLFFGWDIGISLALFFGLLAIAAIACNGVHATRDRRIILSAVFIAGLVALVEDVNLLSATMATLATAMFIIVMTAREPSPWQRDLFEAATFPLKGPFQLIADVIGAVRHMKRLTPDWLGWLIAWIVPLSIFAIFLSLLASANPLIENGLKWIDLRYLIEFFESWRVAFWIAVACVVWPLIHRRIQRRVASRRDTVGIAPDEIGYLFGETAMLRSLILFNLLFAIQTGLDLAYLWAGARLPNGMSHAEYAHRGAYPLVATALLAAVFVLIAMRPGGPAENSRLIRPLVLAWIAQNIFLVISSMFRLDLYIAAFSLTYLRLAAFIWMVLVAIGLALILGQIVWRKSNAWLLSANAISLGLVLYGYCFLNAPWLVATYNVAHCREVTGTGPSLDINYLSSLGSAQTLPPIEAHLAQFPATRSLSIAYRTSPDRNYLSRPGNWRAWGFRTWRLERYFANTPVQP